MEIFVWVVFIHSCISSLSGWVILSRAEIPCNIKATRRGVAICTMIATGVAIWTAFLLFGG